MPGGALGPGGLLRVRSARLAPGRRMRQWIPAVWNRRQRRRGRGACRRSDWSMARRAVAAPVGGSLGDLVARPVAGPEWHREGNRLVRILARILVRMWVRTRRHVRPRRRSSPADGASVGWSFAAELAGAIERHRVRAGRSSGTDVCDAISDESHANLPAADALDQRPRCRVSKRRDR